MEQIRESASVQHSVACLFWNPFPYFLIQSTHKIKNPQSTVITTLIGAFNLLKKLTLTY